MRPAARQTDQHTCPVAGAPPHAGGPITANCAAQVLVGGQPMASLGAVATCTGVGAPDPIVSGNSTVLVENRPAAAVGDVTAHGGVIVTGLATVLLGASPASLQVQALASAARAGRPFCEL